MSTALILRDRNPDNDFVLRGGPPLYTERTSFYPTNSDITTTTKNLSQHGYRADRYQDFLQDDQNLRSSLRNMSRSLRMVSNDIKQNLQEESTAKRYLQTQSGTVFYQDGYKPEEYEDDRIPTRRPEDRSWLSNSEWNTSAGHHVTFSDNAPMETLLNRTPSFPVTQVLSRTGDNQKEAARLLRTVNTDMGLAEVPLTRFTRKDLLASEYFPVTMSSNVSEGSRSPRQSRSRTRSRERLAQSARMRAMTPEKTHITDNFRDMKRLEKLYLVTAEAPATAFLHFYLQLLLAVFAAYLRDAVVCGRCNRIV
ncbi:uncharacterized protein [Littorina saxatilis]|uniref:uncharacterized protein isoform X2 n=1 Tax=Littorina saxatilis TaxID=31220 RepID=UPI0038B60FAA